MQWDWDPWYLGSNGTPPAHWVKDLALPQLQLRSKLQLRSDPWPGNSICCGTAKKKKIGIRFGNRASCTCWDMGAEQSQGPLIGPGLRSWEGGGPFPEMRMG